MEFGRIAIVYAGSRPRP